MSIGERLKKMREARGMTQAELAAKVGTCQQTMIASIEKGTKPMPLGTAITIAEVFGITLDELCKGREAK
jgi:DNA-binding XRE family transcriptional regulator